MLPPPHPPHTDEDDPTNASPAMVFIADMDTWNICWCNKTMEETLGYSLTEMQQMEGGFFKTLMHPNDYPDTLRARELFLEGKLKHTAICRFRGKTDKEWRWFYGTAKVQDYDEAGHLKTIICSLLEMDGIDTPEQAKVALNRLLRKSMKVLLDKLTPAENEILPYFAKGLNNKEIGNQLFKSPLTIETHVKHIKTKLEVHSRAELIALLKRIGY